MPSDSKDFYPTGLAVVNWKRINEILGRKDLKEEDKRAVLGDNARRFYKL